MKRSLTAVGLCLLLGALLACGPASTPTPTATAPEANLDLSGQNCLIIIPPLSESDNGFQNLLKEFREKGAAVTIASTTGNGAMKPDLILSDVNIDEYGIIVLVYNKLSKFSDKEGFSADINLSSLIVEANRKGKIIVATHHAAEILARAGILEGKKATGYTTIDEGQLKQHGATYIDPDVAIAYVPGKGLRTHILVQRNIITTPGVNPINSTACRHWSDLVSVIADVSRMLRLSEPLLFAKAKEENTIHSYEMYLAIHPNGSHVDEARGAIEFCKSLKAEIVASYPKEVSKEQSPWRNVESPIWRWKVEFRELKGTKAFLTHRDSDYISDKGHWYDPGGNSLEIEVPAKGKAVDEDNWVNSPSCNLCGGTAHIEYTGWDIYGNLIQVPLEFKLLDRWK